MPSRQSRPRPLLPTPPSPPTKSCAMPHSSTPPSSLAPGPAPCCWASQSTPTASPGPPARCRRATCRRGSTSWWAGRCRRPRPGGQSPLLWPRARRSSCRRRGRCSPGPTAPWPSPPRGPRARRSGPTCGSWATRAAWPQSLRSLLSRAGRARRWRSPRGCPLCPLLLPRPARLCSTRWLLPSRPPPRPARWPCPPQCTFPPPSHSP